MFVDNKIRDEVTVLLKEVSRKNIMPFYKNLLAEQVYTKSSPTDFVTIADKECEEFLTKKLMQLIAGSKVIGEEASSENGVSFSSFKDDIIWTVDPIDGTKNFVNGNEQFCSMVALLRDGKPEASWIYIPLLDICYFASIKGVEVAHYGTEYTILDVKDKKTIRYLSISRDIQDRLMQLSIYSTHVRMSLVDKSLFKLTTKAERGDKIFIYDGIRKKADGARIYNQHLINEVKQRLSHAEFIHSSDLGLPYEKMPDVYRQCSIGLRLTVHDGNANMVQEMEAMGIPVVHNQSDYGLKWENI